MARPSKYSKELADNICELIATTSKGLINICKENNFPHHATVLKWLGDKEKSEFRDNYTRAREAQADLLADEIIDISDDKSGDTLEGEFGTIGNTANVSRAKVQIDARKWKASKLAPKKYGEKLDITTQGESLKPVIIDWSGGANRTNPNT